MTQRSSSLDPSSLSKVSSFQSLHERPDKGLYPPSVIKRDGSEKLIDNPADFPEPSSFIGKVVEVREPTVRATVIAPDEFTGPIMELCSVSMKFDRLWSGALRVLTVSLDRRLIEELSSRSITSIRHLRVSLWYTRCRCRR